MGFGLLGESDRNDDGAATVQARIDLGGRGVNRIPA
jgi:hypothetical protein